MKARDTKLMRSLDPEAYDKRLKWAADAFQQPIDKITDVVIHDRYATGGISDRKSPCFTVNVHVSLGDTDCTCEESR
jgi:hypothetical protein